MRQPERNHNDNGTTREDSRLRQGMVMRPFVWSPQDHKGRCAGLAPPRSCTSRMALVGFPRLATLASLSVCLSLSMYIHAYLYTHIIDLPHVFFSTENPSRTTGIGARMLNVALRHTYPGEKPGYKKRMDGSVGSAYISASQTTERPVRLSRLNAP